MKGRRRPRAAVCNSVAQSVIEAQRGRHEEFVFVWRRERVKNLDDEPQMAYRPIHTMNNTAWQTARKKAGMPDLHVHDMRHTSGPITRHYTVAQIVELHTALE